MNTENKEGSGPVAGQVQQPVRQHTPGPWVADKVTPRILDGDPYWRVGAVDGTCLYVGCGEEHDEADAHLIAAAPELFAALEGLLRAVQRSVCAGSGPAQEAAHAALHKAVGAA
jgi:hypothetical protein